MTGEKYIEVDVPFCCSCVGFMMIYIGEVEVALNHESDAEYMVRTGKAWKCPKCGSSVIYEWTQYDNKKKPERFKEGGTWKMFLEDHKHLNRGIGKKLPR